MIQINELRIGNLIQEGKIEQIDNGIDEVYYSGNGYYQSNYCCNLNSIILNEELLVKLGFEKKGSFYRIENSRFVEVLIHDDGIDVCNHSVYLPHIKSVHQLQNLYFALVNSELQLLEACRTNPNTRLHALWHLGFF